MDVGTKRPVAELRTRSPRRRGLGRGLAGCDKKTIRAMDTEIDEPTEARLFSFFFNPFFLPFPSTGLKTERRRVLAPPIVRYLHKPPAASTAHEAREVLYTRARALGLSSELLIETVF